MQQRNFQSEDRDINIVQDSPSIQLEEEIKYKSFDDVVKKLRPLKLKGWTLTLNDTVISLKQVEKPFIVPKYELLRKEDLKFSCAVYGWLLPENHELYMKYQIETHPMRIQENRQSQRSKLYFSKSLP